MTSHDSFQDPSAPRRWPIVAGITGGAGVSTVLALLRLPTHCDAGVLVPDEPVDVLVTRSTCAAVAAAIDAAAALSPAPVLVVVADRPGPVPRTVRQRIRMTEPHLPAVVSLDWIDPLRHHDEPLALLGHEVHETPSQERTKWARAALDAAQRIVDTLAIALTAAPQPNQEVTP
ncbi:hypothetical protein [Antrihabitans stalactiti]|uniref:Uncharacterized protein n=1 Tax=Antrihabitans stalactiti TaxID=2584121 RepID=A0A848KM41_9NOCA|nr:hypothetical protein [Antrihabitans stalactiti]NMN99309.1 hypothetical protein [Antrihabitans stalactiti]